MKQGSGITDIALEAGGEDSTGWLRTVILSTVLETATGLFSSPFPVLYVHIEISREYVVVLRWSLGDSLRPDTSFPRYHLLKENMQRMESKRDLSPSRGLFEAILLPPTSAATQRSQSPSRGSFRARDSSIMAIPRWLGLLRTSLANTTQRPQPRTPTNTKHTYEYTDT